MPCQSPSATYQPARAGAADDSVTVLTARGRTLAKRIAADGSTTSYDDARTFDANETNIAGLGELADLLAELLSRPDCAVVRASPIGGPHVRAVRRLLHPDAATGDAAQFYERPKRWLAVDLDAALRPPGIEAADVAACGRHAIRTLPPEFAGKAAICQATASHGRKPGSFLRLWFWLNGAADRQTLQRWFFACPGVDLALFRPVQAIFTAKPIFGPGARDPIPERVAWIDGLALVPLPPPPAPAPPQPPRQPPPALTDRRAEAYRNAALAGIAARLAAAGEGGRHTALAGEACALVRLVRSGSIDAGFARRFIADAAADLNRQGARRIDPEEIAELAAWAEAHA